MGAVIDRDYISGEGESKRIGVMWRDGVKNKPAAIRFRLRDDDGYVYYGGAIDYDDVFGEGGNADEDLPYDIQKWGEYDAGAVAIEFRSDLCPPEYVELHRRCNAVSKDGWVAPYGLPSQDLRGEED